MLNKEHLMAIKNGKILDLKELAKEELIVTARKSNELCIMSKKVLVKFIEDNEEKGMKQ